LPSGDRQARARGRLTGTNNPTSAYQTSHEWIKTQSILHQGFAESQVGH
jgi:hypothetical protein